MFAKINKYKTVSSATEVFSHCDKDVRTPAKHSNRHIDREKTPLNLQYFDGVEATRERGKQRIMYLDTVGGNRNLRKDRVELVEATVYIPKEIKDKESYYRDICDIFIKRYGKENFINAYLHLDEVHEYIDHGVVRESLCHAHVFFVPERENQLVAKEIVNPAGCRELDKCIDEMSVERYGVPFCGESKIVNSHSVEHLKSVSETEAISLLKNAEKVKDEYNHEITDDGLVLVPKPEYESLIDRSSTDKTYAQLYHDHYYQSQDGRIREDLLREYQEEQALIEALQKERDEAEDEKVKARNARIKAEAILEKIEKLKDEIEERIERILEDEVSPSVRYSISQIQSYIEKTLSDDSIENNREELESELEELRH